MLQQSDKLIIALSLLPRVGRKLTAKIVNQPDLLNASGSSAFKSLITPSNISTLDQYFASRGWLFEAVESCEQFINQFEIKFISQRDRQFPSRLIQIPDSPPYLFYKGDLALLQEPQIAIVGSRKASRAGLQHAYGFARELASSGLVITSGLAQGVDASAHRGAVDNGFASVAVMGTGLDSIYPKSNIELANKLLEKGCWVSEYLPGAKPLAANFPRRNRIISGLSLGVLIVEARPKSGTLITARMALEQNRDVFAIPGSIDYKGSHGCNQLIQEGAVLVQSYEDILNYLKVELREQLNEKIYPYEKQGQTPEVTGALAIVLSKLDYTPVTIDKLANDLAMKHEVVQSLLVELELLGCIDCVAGCYQRIKLHPQ